MYNFVELETLLTLNDNTMITLYAGQGEATQMDDLETRVARLEVQQQRLKWENDKLKEENRLLKDCGSRGPSDKEPSVIAAGTSQGIISRVLRLD